MKADTPVQMVDPQGRNWSVHLPAPLAQAMQLQPGQVLRCSVQPDSSLLLKRADAAAAADAAVPPPAAKKGAC